MDKNSITELIPMALSGFWGVFSGMFACLRGKIIQGNRVKPSDFDCSASQLQGKTKSEAKRYILKRSGAIIYLVHHAPSGSFMKV